MNPIARSTNRAWLGEFLRSRRERLSPAEFGFPVMRRRRTAGLRRDEVAQLSGISVAYYTWIEQGRNVNTSSDVLNAIARALKLDEGERLHLFTLVDAGINADGVDTDRVHPTIAHLFEQTSPAFALLHDPWFNVLEATRLASTTLDIEPACGLESNLLYRLFADPLHRAIWVDWESETRMALGMFRQSLARRGDSSGGFVLLSKLSKLPGFDERWSAYDVRVQPSPDEYFRAEPWHLRHGDAGLLRVFRLAITIPTGNDQTLLMCSPADAETSRKFRSLLERQTHRSASYLQLA